ncbi:hypothetical protein, partial [Bradyrhizobium sp. 62]|uniref:hypothetical protein n=1 Tax=Bradyrhizobium sp. 62 TaxID=1043588 RepID=UPI001FF97EB6
FAALAMTESLDGSVTLPFTFSIADAPSHPRGLFARALLWSSHPDGIRRFRISAKFRRRALGHGSRVLLDGNARRCRLGFVLVCPTTRNIGMVRASTSASIPLTRT